MTHHDDTNLIVQKLTDNIVSLLNAYSPGWMKHGDAGYPAPKSKKQLGSFKVNLTGSHQGKWYRFSQGFGGGPVSLLAYFMNGCTHEPTKSELADAFKEARVFLGIDQGEIDHRAIEKAQKHQRQKAERQEAKDARARAFIEEAAMDLWQHATVPQGTLAEVYFKARVRGWDGFHTDQIRFHPEAYYSKTQKLPCIVCLVTGPDGNPVGVWRIYLNRDGTNFRDETGKKVKKGLGPCMETGGAIRLFPVISGVIGACEGVESGYGAWNLSNREIPVWPMMATAGMAKFQPPFEVERVVGFPDGDIEFNAKKQIFREPPGRKAWNVLETRVKAQGLTTGMQPTKWDGTDPLDVWNDFHDRFGAVAA